MPPKKKPRRDFNAQPGIARHHLSVHFNVFPSTVDLLKNGHVLHSFLFVANSSRAETIRHLASHFPVVAFSSDRLKTLVSRTLTKFRTLSNPAQMEKFTEICNEDFNLHPTKAASLPVRTPSKLNTTPPTTPPMTPIQASPPSLVTPLSTRSQTMPITPIKAALRERLAFTASVNMKMNNTH